MKPIVLFSFFFISTLNTLGQHISSKDSTEVSSKINDWNKAWDTKDFVLATKWYSDDARFVNAFGDKRNGQKEIEALLKEVFSLPFVMSGKSETLDQNFQPLSTEIVAVHTSVIRKGQKMPDGSTIPDRQTTHLRIFKKTGESWQIKAHLISDAREKNKQ